MGKGSRKPVTIDVEAVPWVPSATSPASASEAPRRLEPIADAAANAQGSVKPLQTPRLRIQKPKAPEVRCPVCQQPASRSRSVSVGPVQAFLCKDCGEVADGAVQVFTLLKRFAR